jgi:hypothetical protein
MEAFSVDPRLRDGRMSRCKACRYEAWKASECYLKRVAAFKRIPNPWTATEDHLLRQLFPKDGAGACALVMPNRTRPAIIQRAAKLGIPSPARVKQPTYGVPAHDYTAEDYAMRAWRYPVARGQLSPVLRVQG